MKTMTMFALLAAFAAPAQDTHAPDGEGFIRNWLVLAPISIEEGSGASEIDKEQLKLEATIKPKAGEKSRHGGKDIAWKAHKTADFFIDFRESFGAEAGEDVCGYAVAYVWADADLADLKLLIGSNDQAKVYLNGKEVIKFAETRTLEKDQDSAAVKLNKGQNVLILKVINEKNNWQGCARFTDKAGAPIKNLKIALASQ